jgi:membrane protein DedA with SNARE-associated domain
MHATSFVNHLIGASIGGPYILFLTIALGVIFLEDTTVVVVGVLTADALVPIPLALASLYTGIVVGDIGLYWIGRFASTHPRLANYVNHGFISPFRTWLQTRFVLTVFSARFIPGARVPTYIACGFFRMPFPTFITATVGAMTLWTTTLFSLSYWFGNVTAQWMGPARWGVAIVILLGLLFLGRHHFLSYRSLMREDRTDDDIRTPSA